MADRAEKPPMDTDVLTKVLGKGSEALEYLGSENKALDDNESDSKEVIEEYGVFENIFYGDIVLTDCFCSSDENNDPAAAMIPQIVRELVDFEDDPTMPVITWRYEAIVKYRVSRSIHCTLPMT